MEELTEVGHSNEVGKALETSHLCHDDRARLHEVNHGVTRSGSIVGMY